MLDGDCEGKKTRRAEEGEERGSQRGVERARRKEQTLS